MLGPAKILCEVKSINQSDAEIRRILQGGVGHAPSSLDPRLFDKIDDQVEKATFQLSAFDADGTARKLVYVIYKLDENIEFQDEYRPQINAHIAARSFPGSEIEIEHSWW